AACGTIGQLLRRLTPRQLYSHEGLMTRNYVELRHCTASEDRYRDFPFDENMGTPTQPPGDPTDGFTEQVLKFGWPGTDLVSPTHTIDEAFHTYTLLSPVNEKTYRIDAFNPNPNICEGDSTLIWPLVIKPTPGSDPSIRDKLHDAARKAL